VPRLTATILRLARVSWVSESERLALRAFGNPQPARRPGKRTDARRVLLIAKKI
jgi:hypothetical protein